MRRSRIGTSGGNIGPIAKWSGQVACCRRQKIFRLEPSTSELQEAALSFYRNSGYRLIREDLTQIGSNKTVGTGLRRFYFAEWRVALMGDTGLRKWVGKKCASGFHVALISGSCRVT